MVRKTAIGYQEFNDVIKQNAEVLRNKGIPEGHIRKYGFAFQGKKY